MNEFKQQCLQDCMQNDPPSCGAACPFGLDIRDFISKMKRGAFGPAYRAYLNTVAFPGIVSKICSQPCKGACVLSEGNCAISIRDLEAAALKYAPNPLPNCYNMKERPEKISIIGAGLSGLACALRCASKKFQVTVYEASDRIGGALWDMMPSDQFLPELERQFMYEKVEYKLNTKITDLSDLDADIVYVATGENGELFGLNPSDSGATASDRPGFFLGGGVVGHSPMDSIADGLTAAKAIDRYLKTQNMNEPFTAVTSRLRFNPSQMTFSDPVIPADGVEFSKEEAKEEAARCLQCKCNACVEMCDLMHGYQKYPSRIEDEVAITIQPGSLSRNARVATRLISTCNHCGLCKEVCPSSIDTGEFLLESHFEMHRRKAMPWAYHEFWLRDMAFSNGEAALCLPPKNGEKANLMFFPGCRLGGSNPRAVEESYRYLLSKDPATALLLSCCGSPAEWAGDAPLHDETIAYLRTSWESLGRPKIVLACMYCRQEFERYLPEAETCSLYDLLDDQIASLPTAQARAAVAVFDPCASRHMDSTQEAVRSLAQKAGLTLEALPMERNLAQCCGWGGQVDLANPNYVDLVAKKRMDASDAPYVVYCANCRDIFAKRKKESVHILDLIFPPEGGADWTASVPNATESRENRRALKQRMLKEYGNEEAAPVSDTSNQLSLIISPELLEKMSENYLLREDAEAVIAHCEESSSFLIDPELNTRIGHRMVGNMTVWVEYRVGENNFELVNAYAHRLQIMEEVNHES